NRRIRSFHDQQGNNPMQIALTPIALALTLHLTCTMCSAQATEVVPEVSYRSPDRFEDSIQRFEARDAQRLPRRQGIVCVGSSSIRGWHATIQQDLAPLTIIPRGFGGSNMNDALHYADRIVIRYRPRAIVLYEGDNDVAQNIAPAKISATFQLFVVKVHRELPQCRIYFLAIKPSIRRWNLWPRMQAANQNIAAICAKDPRLTYVDVAAGMLNDTGEPRPEIFMADKLHMKRPGYLIWRDALRPVLMRNELSDEK
ncbi:MAG: GDSL-type esterase/lipase family protein, partial [Planctomycetaceae bacterium]